MKVEEALPAPAVAPARPARAPAGASVWAGGAAIMLGAVLAAGVVTAAIGVGALALALHGWVAAVDAARGLWRLGLGPNPPAALAVLLVPLLVGGLAVALALRAGLVNLGVGGQAMAGALGAGVARAALSGPAPWHAVVVVAAAVLAGAVWALPAAVLRAYRGTPELLTTAVLAVIAGGLATAAVADHRVTLAVAARPPSAADAGLAVVAVLVAGLVLDLGPLGRQLGLLRADRPAALALGVPVRRRLLQLLLVSGAVAGLLGLPALGADPGLTGKLATLVGAPPARTGSPTVWLVGLGALAVGLLGRRSMFALVAGALVVGVLIRALDAAPGLGLPPLLTPLLVAVLAATVTVALELGGRGRARLRVRAGQRRAAAAEAPHG